MTAEESIFQTVGQHLTSVFPQAGFWIVWWHGIKWTTVGSGSAIIMLEASSLMSLPPGSQQLNIWVKAGFILLHEKWLYVHCVS